MLTTPTLGRIRLPLICLNNAIVVCGWQITLMRKLKHFKLSICYIAIENLYESGCHRLGRILILLRVLLFLLLFFDFGSRQD